MFFLRPPSDDRVRAALEALAEAEFTHAHVGATRSELDAAPPGFVLDRYGCDLGSGRATFDAARAALRAFAHYPASFTRVVRLAPTLTPGMVFGTVATHFGFASMNPCRVAYVLDEPAAGRFGFGLGTLPGHAAAGEERFLVSRDLASGATRYDVQAFSRPSAWLARLGRPAARRVQRRFQRESCAAMRRIAEQAEAGVAASAASRANADQGDRAPHADEGGCGEAYRAIE